MTPRVFWRRMLLAAAALGLLMAWRWWGQSKQPDFGPDFASGNGRIEATEIDIATKIAGRVREIFVEEDDFVTESLVLARKQVDVLEAQRQEARAQLRRAGHAVAPTSHYISLGKAILFRGAGFDAVWPSFLAVTGIGGSLFVLSLRRFRRTLCELA